MNKYEYGCTAAACLAFLLLRQQDSVSAVTFDSEVRQIVPARSATNHIDAIVKAMHVSTPREKTDIMKIMRRVAETAHSRGQVIIFSDLLVDREQLFKALEMLLHKRHDILLFHIMDADEVNFPFSGITRFEGMEDLPHLICDPRALRDGYLEALEEYRVEVRRGCSRLGIDYQFLTTADYMDAVLTKFLHARMDVRSESRNHGQELPE